MRIVMGWKSCLPRWGHCDNSAYHYGLALLPPWGQEEAEQHAPARQRCDLADELPHLAETFRSICAHSYIVCQIKTKLLHIKPLFVVRHDLDMCVLPHAAHGEEVLMDILPEIPQLFLP